MKDLNKLFAPIGLRVPEILLPARDIERFAVIACDQHTAEPEYWEETERIVGDAPSALHLMLPEAWLGRENAGADVPANMRRYLADGRLRSIGEGFVYVRRRTSEGIRHGLLAAVDLEQYDFSPTADTLMRATEATVRERLPARIALRREAVLEMPHVLVLTDDRENSVTALLERELGSLPKLYDFDLMQGGGHIEGYHVRDERVCAAIADALGALNEKRGNAPLYAVGDGNHSLAAARECWYAQRESIPETEREGHPLRYALVELVSIYDDGLSFHPIHRLLCNVDPEQVQRELDMTEGFDVGYEMSGSGIAFNQMLDNMITGGKIALLGLLSNSVQIDWNKVIFGSMQIKGIYGREMFETWHKMTAMLKSGLDISRIITDEFDYHDFEKGFEKMNGGKSGKIILNWA